MFSMSFKSWAYQKEFVLDHHVPKETEDIQRNTYLKKITKISEINIQ
jgi:hypothetical protein